MYKFKTLKETISSLASEKEYIIVAIDGSCASGKTTLASQLAKHFDCNLFHADDFFLPPDLRTPERLAETGGNIDYDRLLKEVITPLLHRKNFSYRPYDCSTRTLAEPISVTQKPINIIEGSYSLHPRLAHAYDLKILLTVSDDLRRERILRRPEHLHHRFFNEWIPMEQKYFTETKITERCDLIL